MPWWPAESTLVAHDPRLDPFRDRVARLLDDEGIERGMILIATNVLRTVTGGHLWWRRFSEPREILHGFVELDDGIATDWWSDGDELTHDLTELGRGVFTWVGTTYRLEWLPEHEAAAVRDDFRGHDA